MSYSLPAFGVLPQCPGLPLPSLTPKAPLRSHTRYALRRCRIVSCWPELELSDTWGRFRIGVLAGSL